MHVMVKLWMHVIFFEVFTNVEKNLPINTQTIVHRIGFYQGSIHESWNKISWLLPTRQAVYTGATGLEK